MIKCKMQSGQVNFVTAIAYLLSVDSAVNLYAYFPTCCGVVKTETLEDSCENPDDVITSIQWVLGLVRISRRRPREQSSMAAAKGYYEAPYWDGVGRPALAQALLYDYSITRIEPLIRV